MRRAALAATLAVIAMAVIASAAQAATPAWKLLAVTGPTNLPPRQSEVQQVTVEGDGGSFELTAGAGEGSLTPVSYFGSVAVTTGSPVATIESVEGAGFEVGDRVAGAGLPYGEAFVVSCSTDCKTPGSTVTFSVAAEETATESFALIYTREATVEEGTFPVGDEISGVGGAYFVPGTVVSAVSGSTIELSKPPSSEYFFGETVRVAASVKTAPIAYDASAAAVQSALESALGSGSVTVAGGPGVSAEHPYTVEFDGPAVAEMNVSQLRADTTGLEGEDAAVHVLTTLPGGPGTGHIAIDPANIGGASTSGEYTLQVGPLPAGVVLSGFATGEGWSCNGAAGESAATCTSSVAVRGITPANNILIPVEVQSDAEFSGTAPVAISGGGAGSETVQMPIVVSTKQASSGVDAFWAGAYNEDGELETQAGGHPYSADTYFMLNTDRLADGKVAPVGEPKNVIVDLPPGFVGNPLVTPRCPQGQLVPPYSATGSFGSSMCNAEMAVGQFSPSLDEFGESSQSFVATIDNDVPAQGYAAEFTTRIAFPLQSLLGSLRSSEDFGIRITAPNNPNYARIYGAFAAIEGFPAGGHGKPFLRNPTECSGSSLEVRTKTETWQEQGVFSLIANQVLPPVTGCDKLQFDPEFSFQPTTTNGSSGTGATTTIHVSQESFSNPEVLATPDVKSVVAKLPEGMTLNPSAANGLEACSEQQIGFLGTGFETPNPIHFDEAAPTCPEGSKLGTVELSTPLLEEKLDGTIYLAAQEENPFHSLLAIYLVFDSPRFGLMLKLPGEVQANPSTGQLTAIFEDDPQLPFEDLTLHLRGGGPQSEFATPEVCGHYAATGELTPWSAPESGPPAQISEAGFDVSGGCAPSAGQRAFSPTFEAGTTGSQAGSNSSALVIKVNRQDGEQELSNLDLTLPKGLVANIASVPYCSDAAIEAARTTSGRAEQASPSCPAASELGTVEAAAGVGSEPIHVGGHVYWAGPYKGAPFSVVVITPAVAGPFDLGDVVVRAPVSINSTTAQVSTGSDAIPTILQGIPLKVRSLTITLNRPGFVIDPTSCEPMTVTGTIDSSDGAVAAVSSRFHAGGCEGLSFAPVLKASTTGHTTRKEGASLHVSVTYPQGSLGTQANLKYVRVELPRGLPSRLATLKLACTSQQFAQNPAGCPAESIVGHAVVHSPVLPVPLEGPAYFVSHGGEAFPSLIMVLQGDGLTIELVGQTEIKKGVTSSTFSTTPDVPFESFEVTLPQGEYSALAANGNLCQQKLVMPTRMIGQNGKSLEQQTIVEAQGCPNKLSVVGRKLKGRKLKLRVAVPGAGKLSASGRGVSTASVKSEGREAVTITLQVKKAAAKKHESKKGKKGHAKKPKTAIKLLFKPKQGKKLTKRFTASI
jgi:hypothetical protein